MPTNEINVDIIPGIRKLEVFARKETLSKTFEGNWTSVFKGHGMEFAGYRAYTYSDDASLIDWKASLRSKEILVRDYEQERSLSVIFLLDVSNSMLFSSTGKLKAEYAAELVSTLSYAILRTGDSVGLAMFTDKLVTKQPPNIGRSVHYFMVKDLLDPDNYGGNFNLKNALKFLASFWKKRALVIIVSDFLGLDENWYKYLMIASQQYELIGIMVRDPLDRELPEESAAYTVQDPFSSQKMIINPKEYAEAYRLYVQKEELEIERRFKQTKSGFLLLTTDKEFYKPVITFFRKREFIEAGFT